MNTPESDQRESLESADRPHSEHRAVFEAKRTLLKLGWVAPVIVSVMLPRSGFAATVSGDDGKSKVKSDNASQFSEVIEVKKAP